MTRIEVTLGEGDVDTYDGQAVTFMTEPSGALVIFERPNVPWAAYAPPSWKQVNRGSPD